MDARARWFLCPPCCLLVITFWQRSNVFQVRIGTFHRFQSFAKQFLLFFFWCTTITVCSWIPTKRRRMVKSMFKCESACALTVGYIRFFWIVMLDYVPISMLNSAHRLFLFSRVVHTHAVRFLYLPNRCRLTELLFDCQFLCSFCAHSAKPIGCYSSKFVRMNECMTFLFVGERRAAESM